MATGAVTARDPKADATTAAVEAKTEAAEAPQQPLTFKQRFHRLLTEIFEGRQEHLGWRQ
ncbi:MAG TPA: hypothetical protein VK828_09555 [Terriglobales bacterium]|jgi:hypothetical protein|nr:hypothetical protein [Terriglobales bacterium]